jgi:predicted alpha/beta-fold hydrolase
MASFSFFLQSFQLQGPHLHTVYSAQIRKNPEPGIAYLREVIKMADGGEVSIDSYPPSRWESATKAVLFLHGLTGGSDETYIQWAVHTAADRGYLAVVMNARGCGGSVLRTGQCFSAAWTGDVRATVKLIRDRLGPKGSFPLFAAGFSLGAGILSKFIAQEGSACLLDAAAALSPSLCHVESTILLESLLNRFTVSIYRSPCCRPREWQPSAAAITLPSIIPGLAPSAVQLCLGGQSKALPRQPRLHSPGEANRRRKASSQRLVAHPRRQSHASVHNPRL